MRKINNQLLNSWRYFTTPFDIYSQVVDKSDYVKFCGLIDQVVKQLFNIDYNASFNIPYKKFKCYDDCWEEYKKNEDGKNLRKIDTLCEIEPYNLKISFIFDNIDNHSIFERCEIYVINQELLSKLPVGYFSREYAYCSCFFDDNMAYTSSTIQYLTTVTNPSKDRGYNFNYPNLTYTYFIDFDKISFQLEYTYEDGNSKYQKDFCKYFLIELTDISSHMLLRIRQLNHIFNLYSAGVDLSPIYPDINYNNVQHAGKLKEIVSSFIQLLDDESDNILTLKMATI